jgi:hypothetical protein
MPNAALDEKLDLKGTADDKMLLQVRFDMKNYSAGMIIENQNGLQLSGTDGM